MHGLGHGLLLTGDASYVDTWRGVLDKVNENSRTKDGQTLYPHMYGADGWYDFRPHPFSPGVHDIWYWSQCDTDRQRIAGDKWVQFLEGDNPLFPEEELDRGLSQVRDRMSRMAADETAPDTRLSDDMNPINPAVTEALVRLMLGGIPVGRSAHTLHCRLRYFDPEKRRAGLPEDVAALVEAMSDDSVTVQFVNLDPVRERFVVVQGGAYSEHKMGTVALEGGAQLDVTGDRSAFTVRLAPGAGGRITISQDRFSRQPTFTFPWDR